MIRLAPFCMLTGEVSTVCTGARASIQRVRKMAALLVT
jgi:hypothetical protein